MVQPATSEESALGGPAPPPGPAPPCPTLGWDNITASALLARGPVLFWGIVLSDAAAIVATVYDGQNTGGRRVCSAQTVAAVTQTVPVLFTKPVLLRNGLYVDLSAAPDDCLVLFEPLRDA